MTSLSTATDSLCETCPACGASLPVLRGYVTWCHACGWNLRPQRTGQAGGPFDALNARLGERQGRSLLLDVLRRGAARPRLRPAHLLSAFLAGWVLLPGLALAPLGGWLLWQGLERWWAALLGLLCLGLAWAARPRFQQPAQDFLPPADYPALYALVNTVAARLGAPAVERIYPRPWFDASASREGRRRSPSLYLGLPLWAALNSGEKLALLAHELAHLVNGDPTRGALTGAALETLGRWYALLRPSAPSRETPGLPLLAMVPLNLALSVASLVVWLHALALAALLWRDQQRAEYYADALAAGACGAPSMLSLLEKLHHVRTFQSALGAWCLDPDLGGGDFFSYLRLRLAETPERELERIRQVELLEATRLDTRHPPTAYRVHALLSLQSGGAAAPDTLSGELDWSAVESELAAAYLQVQSELYQGYLRGLYR